MIQSYLTEEVTLVQSAGEDMWGEPQGTNNVTLRARIERAERITDDGAGGRAKSRAVLWLGNRAIAPTDQLRFDGKDHSVIRVEHKGDFSPRHIKVWVA